MTTYLISPELADEAYDFVVKTPDEAFIPNDKMYELARHVNQHRYRFYTWDGPSWWLEPKLGRKGHDQYVDATNRFLRDWGAKRGMKVKRAAKEWLEVAQKIAFCVSLWMVTRPEVRQSVPVVGQFGYRRPPANVNPDGPPREIVISLSTPKIVRMHQETKGLWRLPEHGVREHLRHLKDGRVIIVRAHKRGDPNIPPRTRTKLVP